MGSVGVICREASVEPIAQTEHGQTPARMFMIPLELQRRFCDVNIHGACECFGIMVPYFLENLVPGKASRRDARSNSARTRTRAER